MTEALEHDSVPAEGAEGERKPGRDALAAGLARLLERRFNMPFEVGRDRTLLRSRYGSVTVKAAYASQNPGKAEGSVHIGVPRSALECDHFAIVRIADGQGWLVDRDALRGILADKQPKKKSPDVWNTLVTCDEEGDWPEVSLNRENHEKNLRRFRLAGSPAGFVRGMVGVLGVEPSRTL